jgi:hypothetical protein
MLGFPHATNAGIPGEVTLTLHNRRRSDSRRVAVPPVAVLPRVSRAKISMSSMGAGLQHRSFSAAGFGAPSAASSAAFSRLQALVKDGPLSVLRLALFSGFMVRKACGRLSPRKAVHSTIKG